ncbi:MAG: putative DNA binding domain-containing protein [Anaerolineae bacterium]|nr:putative DNA binding domain-containing protein [Anaerolineae bacterium]
MKKIKMTLWFYEECLKDDMWDVGSPLSFQQELEALLPQLALESAEAEQLERRFDELNQRWQQIITAHPRQYRNKLKKTLATELRIIEADLGFLPRLIYEEALHLWVAVETAGHVLDELDRVDGTARYAGERARYETLWRRLEERILELPQDSEVRQTRLATLPPPPPAVTLPDVLSAVRRWTPAERYALGQELEREYLYETVGPAAGQRAVAEEKADYSPGESEAQTMNQPTLQDTIGQGETLTVEFKSDRGPFNDAELLNTVVCMANATGGVLLIGVEDDGTITGLHPTHRTRPELLTAFIASRTVPPLTVEVTFETLAVGGTETPIAVLRIPAGPQTIATSDGRLLVRYLDTHGRPGCRPLYPHELASWRADRGQIDVTARPLPGATWDNLDPLEFARLRRMVEENRGDAALLELSDQEIARALGLVRADDGMLTPTLAGLLLVGREAALQKYVPAHEAAFQVLRGTDVAVNEFRRWPLLRVHEWLIQAIDVRNEEQELMVGAFRVGVPRYDRRGTREAINNALIHRDYGQLGATHIQLHNDHALVTNPGGFVANVHTGNLLVVAPRPRNPLLADVFKRIGLVERTGRGISIIYAGQLQNGRRPPSYDRSTETSVTVTLDSGPADMEFVESVIGASKHLSRALTVPELLVLWEAWTTGHVTVTEVTHLIQRDQSAARDLLRQLQRNELVASFTRGGRRLYRPGPALGGKVGHIGVGPSIESLSRSQMEDQVIAHVRRHGRIQCGEVETLTGQSRDQAYRLLKHLVEQGKLELMGRGRAAHYRPAADALEDDTR